MKGASTLAVSSLIARAAATVGSVIRWDIEHRQPAPSTRRLGRRAGSTYTQTITNEQLKGGYFAACKIGTPAQSLTLQLDTGSSDIWIPASSASVCSERAPGGCTLGTFTSSRSSTFDDVDPGGFDIQYVDGSESKGDYFTDVFQIASATLSNMTMGLGLETSIPYGLVGVGYAINEAGASLSRTGTVRSYPNLPINMMDEGLINTVAYSLWLNDLDASTGSILFGGIDTEKYHGELTRVNIIPTQGFYTSFMVYLTSMSAYSSSGSDALTSSQFPIPVVLDSGTTLSYLPDDIAKQIWIEVGAEYSPDYGIAVIPCNRQSNTGYFSFEFGGEGGARINVTMDELVLDLTDGQAPRYANGQFRGQEMCEFGIQNLSLNVPYLLGDTFLRSAYVVYDLMNNEIGLAPTDFNATTTNVIAFDKANATIPNSTPAPNQAQPTQASSTSAPGYDASAGFGASNEQDSAATAGPGPLSFAGIAVTGSALFFTAISSGIFLLS